MRNSFKDLEELEMREISNESTTMIRNGIASDIGIMKYVSSIIEMYFPKIVDLFIGLAGGSPSAPASDLTRKSRYPDLE